MWFKNAIMLCISGHLYFSAKINLLFKLFFKCEIFGIFKLWNTTKNPVLFFLGFVPWGSLLESILSFKINRMTLPKFLIFYFVRIEKKRRIHDKTANICGFPLIGDIWIQFLDSASQNMSENFGLVTGSNNCVFCCIV